MARSLKACACGALAGVLVLSQVSLSLARPDARTLTCAEVQALLTREGGATLSTGDHTYERYVSSSAACPGTQVARRATIATKDSRQCEVYQCELRVRRTDQ